MSDDYSNDIKYAYYVIAIKCSYKYKIVLTTARRPRSFTIRVYHTYYSKIEFTLVDPNCQKPLNTFHFINKYYLIHIYSQNLYTEMHNIILLIVAIVYYCSLILLKIIIVQ